MNQPIELYLVSGFLGSGKTTFLQNILGQIQTQRIGVIVNEFGSVGIDGKIIQSGDLKLVEINNGSIFCACLKGDFVKALVAFLEQPIDVLFVEASGMADPTSMQSLLEQVVPYVKNNQGIARGYDYKGSACIVDGVLFLKLCDVFTPSKNQVIKSDFVVLNKMDQIDSETVELLHQKIRSINPRAYIYNTSFGKVPLEELQRHIAVGDESLATSNTPWNRPANYMVHMEKSYPLLQVEKFCKEMAAYTLRIKGIFDGEEGRMRADCVGDATHFIRFQQGDSLPAADKKLILIGRGAEEFKDEITRVWWEAFGCEPELVEEY